MSIESWMTPEEVADLAAHASAVIDAALVGTDLSREAYWAAVRKGYNTPYNDPPKRKASVPHNAVPVPVPGTAEAVAEPSPTLVVPAIAAAEIRAL